MVIGRKAASTRHQLLVEEFMQRAEQALPDKPTEPSKHIRVLRARLILEEALETIQKGLGVEVWLHPSNVLAAKERHIVDFDQIEFRPDYNFDMVELVDGCCDVKVVTTGTLSACGVSDVDVQDAVDESNLAKFKAGYYIDDHGKLIKPSDWQAPPLLDILERQGYEKS